MTAEEARALAAVVLEIKEGLFYFQQNRDKLKLDQLAYYWPFSWQADPNQLYQLGSILREELGATPSCESARTTTGSWAVSTARST